MMMIMRQMCGLKRLPLFLGVFFLCSPGKEIAATDIGVSDVRAVHDKCLVFWELEPVFFLENVERSPKIFKEEVSHDYYTFTLLSREKGFFLKDGVSSNYLL